MKTLIINASKALGDSLAWTPYVEEYRQLTGNQVYYSTSNRELFEGLYPNIKFVDVDPDKPVIVREACTVYRLSFGSDYDNHRIPMQYQVARQLRVPYRELRPRVATPENIKCPVEGDYVCLGIQSTAQMKYWNHKGGWQTIIDYLNDRKITPVIIDRYPSFGLDHYVRDNHVEQLSRAFAKCDPSLPLSDRINDLLGARAFIGLGSGLSWLAWALYTPVVMIAGFSKPYYEFQDGNFRVHNNTVCNGCFNVMRMNPRVWSWCPLDTKKEQFECSKEITPAMVIAQLERALRSPLSDPVSRFSLYRKMTNEWLERDPTAAPCPDLVFQET